MSADTTAATPRRWVSQSIPPFEHRVERRDAPPSVEAQASLRHGASAGEVAEDCQPCGMTPRQFSRGLAGLAMLQYCAACAAWALIVCTDPREQEEDEQQLVDSGRQDNAVRVAYVVAFTGTTFLVARFAVVILICVRTKGCRDARDMEYPAWLEIAQVVSVQLSFCGLSGAVVYAIVGFYLESVWNHPKAASLSSLFLVCAVVELTLGIWIAKPGCRTVAELEEEDHWHPSVEDRLAEEQQRPTVQLLLCHSCRPSQSSSDLEAAAGAASATPRQGEAGTRGVCQGCQEAEQMQVQSAPGAFHITDEDAEEVLCSICLMRFKDGELLGMLPCEHLFHRKCIGTWLERAYLCPMRCHPSPKALHKVSPPMTLPMPAETSRNSIQHPPSQQDGVDSLVDLEANTVHVISLSSCQFQAILSDSDADLSSSGEEVVTPTLEP